MESIKKMTRKELENQCVIGQLFKEFIREEFGDDRFEELSGKCKLWMIKRMLMEKGFVKEEEHEED